MRIAQIGRDWIVWEFVVYCYRSTYIWLYRVWAHLICSWVRRDTSSNLHPAIHTIMSDSKVIYFDISRVHMDPWQPHTSMESIHRHCGFISSVSDLVLSFYILWSWQRWAINQFVISQSTTQLSAPPYYAENLFACLHEYVLFVRQ